MPARTTSRLKRGFIWLPRVGAEWVLEWDVKVNGTSVRVDLLDSSWTKSQLPDIGTFSIDLINADSKYNGMFSQNQTVNLYMDFENGDTLRYTGKIDLIKNRYDANLGYVYSIAGSHVSSIAVQRNVTAVYSGLSSVTSILQAIAPSGLTTTNVSTFNDAPTISFDGKSFAECVGNLMKVTDAYAYIDDNTDLHFFAKSSIENNHEAVVFNDNLVSMPGLGQQIVTTKNQVLVTGDDGTGLPILTRVIDSPAQTNYGLRELFLYDNQIRSYDEAVEIGEAELNTVANPLDMEGSTECLILPSLQPGDRIWVTNPPMGVHGQFDVYSLTHKLPAETTSVTFGTERTMKQIFRKRIEKEFASKTIVNPKAMIRSWNFTFDDDSMIATKDSNVSVSGGKLQLTSGSEGVMISDTNTVDTNFSYAQVLLVGESADDSFFDLSTDNGVTYQRLTSGIKNINTLSSSGKDLVLKVQLNNSSAKIDSVAVLLK